MGRLFNTNGTIMWEVTVSSRTTVTVKGPIPSSKLPLVADSVMLAGKSLWTREAELTESGRDGRDQATNRCCRTRASRPPRVSSLVFKRILNEGTFLRGTFIPATDRQPRTLTRGIWENALWDVSFGAPWGVWSVWSGWTWSAWRRSRWAKKNSCIVKGELIAFNLFHHPCTPLTGVLLVAAVQLSGREEHGRYF